MKVRRIFRYWRSTFPHLLAGTFLAELAESAAGCTSALDLGCGGGSPVRHLGIPCLAGMDGHPPALDDAKHAGTHQEYFLGDVREIGTLFAAGRFDACFAVDLIEHLTKEDGLRLLRDMERVASKRVIIFTPNGFLPQRGAEDDLQEHLSGWEPEEMQALGYSVIGMHGPKFLRGEYHRSRMLPREIAGPLSVLGHFLYTRRHPEHASAMLCVKDLDSLPGRTTDR
jgi:SAM-dependent methyltransferase